MTDKLTFKPWYVYKVEHDGVDVTSTYAYVYSFYEDGSYIINSNEIFASGPNFGVWSLSGSRLDLSRNGTWDIKTLTDTELILKYADSDYDYVVYFN